MPLGSTKFEKNIAANVIAGGSNALVALVLPAILVRQLTHGQFTIWVLMLQLASYANFLNLGLQVAVGRYVADGNSRGDEQSLRDVLSAGVQILTALAAIGALALIVATALMPYLFSGIELELVGDARIALLCLGSAVLISLPFGAFTGFLIGLQRNDLPAIATLAGNIVLTAGVGVTAIATRSLVGCAVAYLCASVATSLAQFGLFRLWEPNRRVDILKFSKTAWRTLSVFSAGLSGWSFAMFLVSGLDLAIVAFYDFRNVAPYGIATSATLILLGTIRAVLSPTIQVFASLNAQHERARLATSLCLLSYGFTMLMIVLGSWLVVASYAVFPLWVGRLIGIAALPYFLVLVVATVLRNTPAPYSQYLVATAQQTRALPAALIEGVSNLIASILLARWLGAIGVAFGTLIGAIAGILGNRFYSVPRTIPAGIRGDRLLSFSLIVPALYCAPLLAIAAYSTMYPNQILLEYPAMLLGTLLPAYQLLQTWRASRYPVTLLPFAVSRALPQLS